MVCPVPEKIVGLFTFATGTPVTTLTHRVVWLCSLRRIEVLAFWHARRGTPPR